MSDELALEAKPKIIIRKQVAKILPFIDPDTENMGLTKYNMVLHEGANQKEALTYLEPQKGVRRYLTGLNEQAPEVQQEPDKEKREAMIKEIRTKVAFLEARLNNIEVSIEDDKFWFCF